jgi:hypothetical protein
LSAVSAAAGGSISSAPASGACPKITGPTRQSVTGSPAGETEAAILPKGRLWRGKMKGASLSVIVAITLASTIFWGGIVSATPSVARYSNSPTVEVKCTRSDEGNLTRHGCYINRYGNSVHRPSRTHNGAPPAKATARCGDGTYSFSQHASGTCSHHRGVQSWL